MYVRVCVNNIMCMCVKRAFNVFVYVYKFKSFVFLFACVFIMDQQFIRSINVGDGYVCVCLCGFYMLHKVAKPFQSTMMMLMLIMMMKMRMIWSVCKYIWAYVQICNIKVVEFFIIKEQTFRFDDNGLCFFLCVLFMWLLFVFRFKFRIVVMRVWLWWGTKIHVKE